MQWSPRRFASGAPGPGSFVEAGARRGGWGGAGLGGAGAGVLVTSGAGRGRAACAYRVVWFRLPESRVYPWRFLKLNHVVH